MRLADVKIMAIAGALPLPVIHNEVVACRRYPPVPPPGYSASEWPPNAAPPNLPWATSPAPQGWERWPCRPETAIHGSVFNTVLSYASPGIAFWLGNGHPFKTNPAKCTEMQALSRCMLDFKMTPEDPWGSVAAMQRVGARKWLNPRVDLRKFVHDATDTGPLGLHGRVGLQGQIGLCNAGTTTIPAYTFLGWYHGTMCAADSPMLQHPGVEDRLFDVNWPISGGECLIVPDDDCLLQFANDPSLNLYNKRNNMTARFRQNAVFVVIAVCGVPMAASVSQASARLPAVLSSTSASSVGLVHCAPCPVGSYQSNVQCVCLWCTNAPLKGGIYTSNGTTGPISCSWECGPEYFVVHGGTKSFCAPKIGTLANQAVSSPPPSPPATWANWGTAPLPASLATGSVPRAPPAPQPPQLTSPTSSLAMVGLALAGPVPAPAPAPAPQIRVSAATRAAGRFDTTLPAASTASAATATATVATPAAGTRSGSRLLPIASSGVQLPTAAPAPAPAPVKKGASPPLPAGLSALLESFMASRSPPPAPSPPAVVISVPAPAPVSVRKTVAPPVPAGLSALLASFMASRSPPPAPVSLPPPAVLAVPAVSASARSSAYAAAPTREPVVPLAELIRATSLAEATSRAYNFTVGSDDLAPAPAPAPAPTASAMTAAPAVVAPVKLVVASSPPPPPPPVVTASTIGGHGGLKALEATPAALMSGGVIPIPSLAATAAAPLTTATPVATAAASTAPAPTTDSSSTAAPAPAPAPPPKIDRSALFSSLFANANMRTQSAAEVAQIRTQLSPPLPPPPPMATTTMVTTATTTAPGLKKRKHAAAVGSLAAMEAQVAGPAAGPSPSTPPVTTEPSLAGILLG